MPKESSPAYQWYLKDWRSSRATQRMSFSERGVYREMLDQQWEDRTLPDDAQAVAELIASTAAQVDEVLAAWLIVRRKFVTTADGRLQNVRLEKCRKEKRRFEKWSKKTAHIGGQARAASAVRGSDGTFQSSSVDIQRYPAQDSSGDQPDIQRYPATASASSSASATASASAIFRARPTGGALAGSLPRDHVAHVFCDETFSRCVPSAVHDKLANLLAPKHGGDRQAAKAALVAWYPSVVASLAADFVMGDAFKFWQARFDAAFANADAARRPMFTETTAEMAEGVRQILHRQPGIPR